jgi:hypothetical protein
MPNKGVVQEIGSNPFICRSTRYNVVILPNSGQFLKLKLQRVKR